VRGPDNRQLFCVYHRWREGAGRVLSIDRLDWVGERMTVIGPSYTPQPAPNEPTFADYFDEAQTEGLGDGWQLDGGRWSVRDGEARQEATEGEATAVCALRARSFVAELSLRALTDDKSDAGAFGVSLANEAQTICRFVLRPAARQAVLLCADGAGGWRPTSFSLPTDFVPDAFHLLRVEVDERFFHIELDDGVIQVEGVLHGLPAPDRLALFAEHTAAAFAGFALTRGWEDLFMSEDWRARGWQVIEGEESWRVKDQELRVMSTQSAPQVLCKGALLDDYELVINARLTEEATHGSAYGFYPAFGAETRGPLFTVEQTQANDWTLVVRMDDETVREFPLAQAFDPHMPQQFRLRKEGARLHLQHEATPLGGIAMHSGATRVALYARGHAAFDLVRVTEIKSRKS
jgi:hypothetical protein